MRLGKMITEFLWESQRKNDDSTPINVDDGGILLGFYVAKFVASFVAAHLQDFRAFIQCGSRIGHQDLHLLGHTEVTKRRAWSVCGGFLLNPPIDTIIHILVL